MGFLDVLRKLGILRFGATAGVYHDAVSRPLEFTDDGVFNAGKDLAADKPAGERCKAGERPAKQAG